MHGRGGLLLVCHMRDSNKRTSATSSRSSHPLCITCGMSYRCVLHSCGLHKTGAAASYFALRPTCCFSCAVQGVRFAAPAVLKAVRHRQSLAAPVTRMAAFESTLLGHRGDGGTARAGLLGTATAATPPALGVVGVSSEVGGQVENALLTVPDGTSRQEGLPSCSELPVEVSDLGSGAGRDAEPEAEAASSKRAAMGAAAAAGRAACLRWAGVGPGSSAGTTSELSQVQADASAVGGTASPENNASCIEEVADTPLSEIGAAGGGAGSAEAASADTH